MRRHAPCTSCRVQQPRLHLAGCDVHCTPDAAGLPGRGCRSSNRHSQGHSFERAALEAWLAANPGVDPLARQLLLPEASTLLPNHALRNMIQQLQLS